MFPSQPLSIISLLGCVLYLVTAIIALRIRGYRFWTNQVLLIYLGLAFSISLLGLLGEQGIVNQQISLHFNHYWLIITVFLFLELTWKVLQTKPRKLPLLLGIVWVVGYALLDFNLIGLSEHTYRQLQFAQPELARTFLAIGWLGFTWYLFTLALQALRNPHAPLIRNHGYYWTLVLIFISGSDFLFVFDYSTLGHILHWPGILFAASVILREFMPDIRQAERLALNYLVMTILTAIVLIFGLILTPPLFIAMQTNYNSALSGMVVAIFLAALLSPLWVFSQKIVQRIFPSVVYDRSLVLREYSQSLSNILDPDLLAKVAVRLVSEAIEIEHGFLFLVDHDLDHGQKIYRLRPTKGIGEIFPEAGNLAVNSPIATFLRHEHKPLRQTDIDLKPTFQTASPAERAWFTSLGAEVYMPIFTKEDWVGLIVLGPKTSGLPYLNEDMTLLETLADQTVVALQNARLVETLMGLNNDFRRAYLAMEQANSQLKQVNQQLQKIDRTKSDFTRIASHEMRTSLTVIRNYNEMLLEDPVIIANPFHARLINGIYFNSLRMHEIINSMQDIGNFEPPAPDINRKPTSLDQVIHNAIIALKDIHQERNLDLDIGNLRDLPQIEGDCNALSKVFYQIILNAIKFTPDGGKIIVSGKPVSAGPGGMPEAGIEIIVADTGIGIDPDSLNENFNNFFQAGEMVLQPTGKTQIKGTRPGLGLAIARAIVEAHQGTIKVESPGYDETRCPGSEFHIFFPLHFHETTY
jgi:signal transduction histidine kinase